MTPPRDPVAAADGDRVRLLLELRARIAGQPAGTVIHLIAPIRQRRSTCPPGAT